MSRGQSLAIAGLSCALLCAWGAFTFLRGTRGDERGDGGATSTRAVAATAIVDPARADRGGGDDGASDTSKSRDLTPKVVAVDPRLEWPDAASLRRITQRGRTLFGGVVYAPDGSPCPGATVSCAGGSLSSSGETIATSDDHGAWRADVGRPAWYDFDADVGFTNAAGSTFLLTARREGVGFAEAGVSAGSRRIDFHLESGFAFRGIAVDNDDLHPVGGAEIEAHVRSLVERVHTDERGAFSFENLPSGNLDLSGRAPGYDSNGSFPYNFERGRDVTITFRLTKAYRLRGQFVPWPLPDLAAAHAAVIVSPRSPHGGSSAPRLEGAVDDDGSFDAILPVCPECHVELTVAGGSIWQTDLDVNEEKHDVDLGRIELGGTGLARTSAVVGRVEIPDKEIRATIEVAGEVMVEGQRPSILRRNVAADGSFRLAPLPAGSCSLFFAWSSPDHAQAGVLTSLQMTGGPSSVEGGLVSFELAPGETRDVGSFTTTDSILVGTVRDGRGEPIALAQVRVLLDDRSLPSRRRPFRMYWSDEEGRFGGSLGPGSEVSSPLDVMVRARGFASIRVDVDFPARGGCIRRDFVLQDGVVLEGSLQDEHGAPLSDWAIRATPADAPDERADDRAGFDVTQSDGSFVIRGLTMGEWTIRALPRGGTMVEFTKIHPERGPVTLRTQDGVAVSSRR